VHAVFLDNPRKRGKNYVRAGRMRARCDPAQIIDACRPRAIKREQKWGLTAGFQSNCIGSRHSIGARLQATAMARSIHSSTTPTPGYPRPVVAAAADSTYPLYWEEASQHYRRTTAALLSRLEPRRSIPRPLAGTVGAHGCTRCYSQS
jgi:hypothetical protein